jgi:hypothetical protein
VERVSKNAVVAMLWLQAITETEGEFVALPLLSNPEIPRTDHLVIFIGKTDRDFILQDCYCILLLLSDFDLQYFL